MGSEQLKNIYKNNNYGIEWGQSVYIKIRTASKVCLTRYAC